MADMDDEELSIDELRTNLENYKEQLKQVEKLLSADPGNSEYEGIRIGLLEVIELTEDLLPSADREESPNYQLHGLDSHTRGQEISPKTRFAAGTKVQAVWSADGEWYDAVVEAITPLGYLVVFEGWGNKEEVNADRIRERGEVNAFFNAEKEAEAARLALKRKIAQSAEAEIAPRGLPTKLQIKPDDPEDVKTAKRKKIHAFKSRMRFEQMESAQNKRQNSWQQFQSSKGKSRKVGYFTGGKRESIFKSPDDPKGKVGVTGSGKGITDFQKREKYLNLKVGNEEEG